MAMTFTQLFSPTAPAVPAAAAPAPTPAPAANPDPFQKSSTPDPVPLPTAPLDQYKDLFTIDPNREVADPNAPFITYDDKALADKVAEMQFVDPTQMAELATKAAQGDAAALMTLLNSTAQSAYSQGAKLAANISNRAAHAGISQVRGQMPTDVRSQLASSELATLNPNLSHPAIADQAQKTLAAFEQKFPTATPAQLAKYTNDYFNQVFAATNGSNHQEQSSGRSGPPPIQGSQDFTDFFGGGGSRR
jgi:hypothetical protein